MKFYRCDKCKKEFKIYKGKLMQIRVYRKGHVKGGISECADVCMKCYKELFKDWLENKTKRSEDEN